MSVTRRLDDRVLPVVAAAAQRLAARIRPLAARSPRLARGLVVAGLAALVAAPLATAAASTPHPTGQAPPVVTGTVVLGPRSGQGLADYLAAAARRRAAVADEHLPVWALVDFATGRTAAEVAGLLPGAPLALAWTRGDAPVTVHSAGDLAARLAARGRAGCGCVNAVLARVTGVDVPDLQSRPGIRLVDPAPAGVPPTRIVARPPAPPRGGA